MNKQRQDDLIRTLKKHGIPVTRENYLDLAYLGQPPKMTAELEASLPESLRHSTTSNHFSTGGSASSPVQSGMLVRQQGLRAANLPPTDDFLEKMAGEL